jgi:hypothetical protein
MLVIAGLDPAITPTHSSPASGRGITEREMDARVKPGHDEAVLTSC